MSYSPSPYTVMKTRLAPMDIKSTKIKMEPEAESQTILQLPAPQGTSITESTPITIFTSTPIPSTPGIAPSFTPIYISTPTPTSALVSSSTPAPAQKSITPIPIPTNRRSGRQGRLPKERTLTKNKPAEVVNYPCYENLSEFHLQKLQELKLYPVDGISKYSRSIPFKGAKESFLKRTGRNRFDVFEYRFTAPNTKGEDKYWWVMWDYYNGLVRVHDFFDCCKPGKTEPGNAVKEKINPGLQQVCHNITGGNLHAQGYWIPYPAAKALATKFCFRIRFALTVIFGDDFPSLCLPDTHPEFGKYAIDPKIINSCQETSSQQYDIEKQRITAALSHPCPSTPPSFSSRISTSASNATSSCSRDSPTFQENRTERFDSRVSVTPSQTPSTNFFDPVRGGYTNGSSNSYSSRSSQLENQLCSTSSPAPVNVSNMKRSRVEKNTKARRSNTLSGGASGSNTSSPTVSLVQQACISPFFPVNRSIYFPESSVRGSQLSISPSAPKTFGKGSIVPRSRYTPQAGGTAETPSNRNPSMKDSLDPVLARGRKEKGITRHSNTRTLTMPLRKPTKAPAPLLPPIESIDLEQPSSKRAKATLPEPRRYNNPYMNPISFVVGTFQTSGPRSSRDGTLPRLQRPFTRERYEELASSQIEESPEDLLAAEAAANLMTLQRRDYGRDFAEDQKGNLHLKRRRSN